MVTRVLLFMLLCYAGYRQLKLWPIPAESLKIQAIGGAASTTQLN